MLVVGSVHPQGRDVHIAEISGSIKISIDDPGLFSGIDGITLVPVRIRQESASIYRDGKLKSVIYSHNGTR